MLGISTYAYLWRRDRRLAHPASVMEILADAARLQVGVVQICDAPELETADTAWLDSIRGRSESLGLTLETGTKGTGADHLRKHLRKAKALQARFVRTMIGHPGEPSDPVRAETELRSVIHEFEDAGITLGLETYEQVATRDLVGLIDAIDSPSLGICLDVSNTVGRLEDPDEVVELTAPYVVNVHVKDFAFTRTPEMVGFTLAGTKLGDGLLNFELIRRSLAAAGKDVNLIVEHWLNFEGSLDHTCEVEEQWVNASIEWLRNRRAVPKQVMDFPGSRSYY